MTGIVRDASVNPSFVHFAKQPMPFILARKITINHPNILSMSNPIELHNRNTREAISCIDKDKRVRSQQFQVMQSALRSLLANPVETDLRSGLSQEFVRGLLMDTDSELLVLESRISEEYELHQRLKGMPQRPFSREIMRRLQIIQRHNEYNTALTGDESEKNNAMFLPASYFGMTELKSMDSLIPDPPENLSSIEDCKKWLQQAGEEGVFAILGMRRTIGTTSTLSLGIDCTHEMYLLPPPPKDLVEASCKLHKPGSKSSLTVGARALDKHADRGQSQFYGSIQGNESTKNDHAKQIVIKLIEDAEWINIHMFGGVEASRPVIEVRTVDGYGARWSAVWNDAFRVDEILFRGFLEPQMEDGHEKRWMH